MKTIYTQPGNFDDLVLKPETRARLAEIISGHKPLDASGKVGLILYGPCGTGKTTAAHLLPALLDPVLAQNPCDPNRMPAFSQLFAASAGQHVMEVSVGSGNRGNSNSIALLNELDAALTSRGSSGYSYVLLHEVDQLTNEARDGLRGFMDRHYRVIYIMTTNHLNKIEASVRDRSYLLDFSDAGADAWGERCAAILRNAGLPEVPVEELARLHVAANGSAREIISSLLTAANRGNNYKVCSLNAADPATSVAISYHK